MEDTPLMSRVKDPNNEFTISSVNNARRSVIFARIITIIGVIIGITVLLADQSSKKTSFKNSANAQQGTVSGKKNQSTMV
jgi:hypothetical protein